MLAVIMAIENEDDRLFVETVFNRYAKKLYLVAYNILGNRADAEDCVQAVSYTHLTLPTKLEV